MHTVKNSFWFLQTWVKSNWSNRPETVNCGQNQQFFVPCDLEIWWMTLKNYRAPLLCYFKLCASFGSHWWIQTGVIVRKHPNWVQTDDFFLAVWPSSNQHQALCIISFLYMNSNWSYSPETAKWGHDLCHLDLWQKQISYTLSSTYQWKMVSINKHWIVDATFRCWFKNRMWYNNDTCACLIYTCQHINIHVKWPKAPVGLHTYQLSFPQL